MKVATGILVDGNVVLEGEASTEGATVIGVLREDPETFDLTPEAALTAEAIALAAREYHARRQKERRAQREALRLQRLTALREAIRRRAPRYPAIGAVYLFGSVLQPGRFTSGSDVDVAVEGADVDTESRFWRALEEDCGGAVDLRSLQGAVARAVADHGERVYVRDLPRT
ncbi:MAG: nucleotidyltransferase domain-containing protein [Pseudomonadota bacterium]|nr:nucleotidyltransferase domain-containing protein [Gammaproteobacteria bacterium]MDQ3582180.1 nucleotidyltransferase domain-containing protein [Pseudomonadota bacterium]